VELGGIKWNCCGVAEGAPQGVVVELRIADCGLRISTFTRASAFAEPWARQAGAESCGLAGLSDRTGLASCQLRDFAVLGSEVLSKNGKIARLGLIRFDWAGVMEGRNVAVMKSICGSLTKAATLQHAAGFFGSVWRRSQTAVTGAILSSLFFMARL
jgi:hypothetical protein